MKTYTYPNQGSDSRTLTVKYDEQSNNLTFHTGCFHGTLYEFLDALFIKHHKNEHGQKYLDVVRELTTKYNIQIPRCTAANIKRYKCHGLLLLTTRVTPQMCLAAVQQYGYAIYRLTTEQRTPKVCSAAVQQHGHVIEWLTTEQRTPEVCLAAVRQYGEAIEWLTPEQRTPEVCLAAVQQDSYAIRWLTNEQINAMREYEKSLEK